MQFKTPELKAAFEELQADNPLQLRATRLAELNADIQSLERYLNDCSAHTRAMVSLSDQSTLTWRPEKPPDGRSHPPGHRETWNVWWDRCSMPIDVARAARYPEQERRFAECPASLRLLHGHALGRLLQAVATEVKGVTS